MISRQFADRLGRSINGALSKSSAISQIVSELNEQGIDLVVEVSIGLIHQGHAHHPDCPHSQEQKKTKPSGKKPSLKLTAKDMDFLTNMDKAFRKKTARKK